MSNPLERAARVTRAPRPAVTVAACLGPGPGETGLWYPLADGGRVYWLHYLGARSRPCEEPQTECPHCRAGPPARLFKAGYLAVWDPRTSKAGVLYLTDNALRCAPDLEARLIDGGLAGHAVKAWRKAGGRGAPMFADLVAPERTIPLKPKLIDLDAFLARLFYGEEVRAGERATAEKGE